MVTVLLSEPDTFEQTKLFGVAAPATVDVPTTNSEAGVANAANAAAATIIRRM